MRRAAVCALMGLLCLSGLVLADGSVIVAEGFSAANNYSGPLPDFFDEWCDRQCVPTVTLAVTDVTRTKRLGFIHAWGKEFTGSETELAGLTLQFKEFILYELRGGKLYTLSEDGGHPGGSFVDTTLIPPKVAGNQVLVGGAEGSVVGGTGKFKDASGGYSTRLKVETPDFQVFTYYDELYFRFREVDVD